MSPVSSIELARLAIGAGEHFAINLVRNDGSEVIIFVWPTQPTEIAPSAFAATVTAIVAALSEALLQLRLIKNAER